MVIAYCKLNHGLLQVSSIGGICGVAHVLYKTGIKFWFKNVTIASGKECYVGNWG